MFPSLSTSIKPCQKFLLLIVAALFVVCIKTSTWASEQKTVPETNNSQTFLQVVKNDKKIVTKLQTGVGRYELIRKGKPKVTVDLIGAVHIGDEAYYETLNKQFKQYDAMLFELVAPPEVLKYGIKPRKGDRSNASFISQLQMYMKDTLKLEFQLEHVDYTPKNFVHADMSPEQLFATMRKKGETPFNLMLRVLQASTTQNTAKAQETQMLMMLTMFDEPDSRALKLKRLFAEEFINNESFMNAMNGKNGLALLTDRNDVALDVMQEQIDAGKTNIGIFYGAAHLPDMHEKLIKTYGMKLDKISWLDAWVIEEE